MSDVSPTKTRLLWGAAALALAAAAPALALAQSGTMAGPPRTPPPPPPGAEGRDGLTQKELYVEADNVVEDRDRGLLTARGNVQARYQGRTLRAQEIVYDLNTGLITANGAAQIINEDGTVEYAENVALDDKLRAGVATGFAARLPQGGKLAAGSAVRRSEAVNELNHAIFTPCPICTVTGKPKTPTWSIQAEKVIQDRDKKLVYYRNAVIQVFGAPVLWAPVLWHPDPTAERASGFLMPRASISDRRGLSYEQPYLWVISPSQDLVVSPQLNQKLAPFVNLDWRKRFFSGQAQARVGATYERNSDSEGRTFGDRTTRSYILADGQFRIDRDWRWGFSAERASDDSLFDRYDVGDIFAQRGLVKDVFGRLTSQLYTERQTQRSYLSVTALSFQSIRAWADPLTGNVVRDANGLAIAENDAALPLIAPLIEGRWEPNQEILGGRLRLVGSAVALERDENSLSPFDPVTDGIDSRRASLRGEWRRSITTRGGVRIEPFLAAQGDYYDISDLPGGGSASLGRGNVTAGADLSYPLARRFSSGSIVIEPIVQVAVSPRADYDPRIPIEDSRSLTLDETNLFRADKFTGFDLYEGGSRVNAGLRGSIELDDGRWARGLVGRSFRSDQSFPAGLGIKDALSNWVVALQAQPIDGIVAFGRAQISDSAEIRRAETGVNWNFKRTRGFARWFRNESDPFIPGLRREDAELAGDLLITPNWGVVFDAIRDLQDHRWRRSEIGLLYQDDCTRVEVVYQRNETARLGPSDAVFLRLNLATLGDAGYKRYDDR